MVSDANGAFGTAAWVGRILATLLTSVILSVVYVDTADASDTTADPTDQIATSESTVVVEDPGATSSTTSPPADSDTTSPPADSDTTSPPADADTTSPPADSETTDPNPDPSGSSGAHGPGDGSRCATSSDGTPGTTDGTDPVDVPPPPVEPGETPSPPSTNDFPSHGLVAASGTNPSPDPVAVAGNAPVESGPSEDRDPIRSGRFKRFAARSLRLDPR